MNKEGLAKIDEMFKNYAGKSDGEIMPDGILCEQEYQAAPLKILWALKQDVNWGQDVSSADDSYAKRIEGDPITGLTWKRMSLVSYGLLTGDREFGSYPDGEACSKYLLKTAVIELNKELGDTRSSDQVIVDGFNRYKDLILLQIDVYLPDVIIVCLPDSGGLRSIVDSLYRHCHKCDFCHGPTNEYIEGADVGIGRHAKPLFLWPYHPQAKKGHQGLGIDDKAYTLSLLNAFDRARMGPAAE